MSGGWGPPLLDFSPIGDLAGTFFDARDKARKRKLEDMQLEAPDEIAKLQLGALSGSPSAPSAPSDPSTSLASLGQPQASKLPTFAGGGSRPMTMPADPELARAIQEHATSAGIDPIDLATAISYETAGTFDPWKAGPKTQWGQHRGLIQWGEPQAKQYGVTPDMPVRDQVAAAVKYLQDRGVKPGMGLMDIYSAINAGSVGRYGASDAHNGGAPGTVADKVNNQMNGHRQKAQALLTLAGVQQGKTLPPEVAGGAPSPFPTIVPQQAQSTGIASGNASEASNLQAIIDNPLTPEPQRQWAQKQLSRRAPAPVAAADAPAPGAQNAQGFAIPGQSPAPTVSAPPQITIPPQIQAALQSKNPYVRKWAADQVQEYQKAQREMGVKLWERQDQRAYDGQVRQQTWGREDQIRAANQDREDKIRQGTWTREDEVRHKTWEREERLKKEERSYQETAPTPDMKEYNFYVQQEIAAKREPQDFTSWQRANKKSGATTIGNIGGQAIEPEFNKTTGKAIGERFDAISKEGDTARSDLAMVDQLRSLGGAINFQTMPALRGELAKYGVKLGDDVGEIQAYNSIIDKLTPAQRIPGAGASSDLDVKMFKSALPQLINTPEGNGLIMEMMQALGEDKIARAVIAERAQTGEITPAQAINELRAMPSPLAAYKQRLDEATKAAAAANEAPAPGKRVQIPQGYTASRVLSEAKESYARANDAQKALIRERVRSYGIDPKRLD